MYRLNARVEIESDRKWEITKVTAIEIQRSTEELTDTCKITLPKRMLWDQREGTPLRRGDKVRVSIGYDDALQLAFVGYIREVGFKTPVELICEDEMYRLKTQPTIPKAYRSATVEQVLKDQGIATPIRVMGEQHLGAYRVQSDTVASLLGQLKEQGVRSFFRYENGEAVLYSGVLFDHEVGQSARQVIASGINLISDTQLKQQHADTLRLKVKAVSLMPEGRKGPKKIKVEVGDQDGELRTLHTYNKSESELRKWAEQDLQRLKRDGLTGSVTTFGYRLIDKLDHVAIRLEGKRMGVYQAKKVVIKYGSEGLHQEVTLGNRVAD